MIVNEQMKVNDLVTALEWAKCEGWNPGLDDSEAFYSSDPRGFYIRRVNGDPAAVISVVNHSKHFSFLGIFICHSKFRGSGHGLDLWNYAINHAGGRCIGLDGVSEQQNNYRKSGFITSGSTLRYEGTIRPSSISGIRMLSLNDHNKIVNLDAEANGVHRNKFISKWILGSSTRQTIVLENEGEVTGFTTYRTCVDGTKIGPIVAPNTATSLGLIGAVGERVKEGKFIVDVPEENLEFRRELENLSYKTTFDTARMYRGLAPSRSSRLHAIATMELG